MTKDVVNSKQVSGQEPSVGEEGGFRRKLYDQPGGFLFVFKRDS